MATEQEHEIAGAMLAALRVRGRLNQARAARLIRQIFGEEHTYRNRNGNLAINAGILEAFRELTPADVVWSRSRQEWRARKPTDPPDSRMVK